MKRITFLLSSIIIFCSVSLYSQDLKVTQEYDKFDKANKITLKTMLSFDENESAGFMEANNLFLNPYLIIGETDTTLTMNMRYASTKLKQFLMVKQYDKAKLLIDNKPFEVVALTASDTASGDIVLENITYTFPKELAQAVSTCKSFEMKIKGSKNTSSGKMDDDDLAILRKFLKKYYIK
ncbi:MAG: hypothetical protein JST55_14940 [Bacteroidetes bacterium]|nr:hypothetical protein [Bacteroidota bacterium]